MPAIFASTFIAAPRERVFDLARCVEARQDAGVRARDKAIGGIMSGLITLDQVVVWRARHLGIPQTRTVKITKFDRPNHFREEMTSGILKSMRHDYTFKEHPYGSLLLDKFEFEAPFSVAGRVAERLVLMRLARSFLRSRNQNLKRIAETDEWLRYIKS